MITFFATFLFLLTIAASFAVGIAAAYWVIREFLNFFDPGRSGGKPARVRHLAHTPSGD